MVDNDVQRTLGRIEGSQGQILDRLSDLNREVIHHCEDDKAALAALWKRVGEGDEKLNNLLASLTRLQAQDEQTKTIGRYIIAFIGGLAGLVGSAVIAALTGHIKIQ